MTGWRCSWQDYTHWRTTDFEEPRPPVMFRDFPSRELAVLEQKLRQSLGMTCCISPTPPPRRRQRKIVGQENWIQGV